MAVEAVRMRMQQNRHTCFVVVLLVVAGGIKGISICNQSSSHHPGVQVLESSRPDESYSLAATDQAVATDRATI